MHLSATRWVGVGLLIGGLILTAVALTARGSAVEASPLVAVRGVSADATADNGQRKLARTTDGTLYLAYSAPVDGVEQAHISFSLDDGQTWKPEITLAQQGIWSDLPTLASGPDGRLDAAWVDYASVGHVWYASRRGGVWSDFEKISPGPHYAGFPALVVSDNGADVLWYAAPPSEVTEHGSEYEIHHTTGGPGTWSEPEVLSSGSEDALNPSLARSPDGSLEAAWFQFGSNSYGVQHSTFSESAWASPSLISAPGSTGTGTNIEVGPDHVTHLVWEQTDGTSNGVSYSRDEGSGWSPETMLSSVMSNDPVVGVDDQLRVYALWSQEGRIMGRLWDDSWSDASDLGPGTNPTLLSGERVMAAWTRPAAGSHEVVTAFLRTETGVSTSSPVLVAAALIGLIFGGVLTLRSSA